MASAAKELEHVSDLCGRIGFSAYYTDAVHDLLEPVASFLGAETASFRTLSLCDGRPKLHTLAVLGIPDSVNDAYLTRYAKLDPARRLLAQRLAQPLFADRARYGEWSNEQAAPALLRRYREEFQRYRKEFLLPSGFYYHVGFCFQDSYGHTLLFDFHRKARSREFSRLDRARAQIVGLHLHAKAGQCRHADAGRGTAEVGHCLSAREYEVAGAVALGLSNKEVAASLGISVRTVENHMRSIFAKLAVRTRARLCAKLREAGVRPSERTVA